ncbi:MAG: HK97 family phage prohead protease [Burkholderiales bacterium]|nr:HK97 family phage prohead protease [Burkholderiales bacterium]
MQHCVALLEVKSIDDDAREITGFATTPQPDSAQDIVEPRGAVFDLPLPLLFQHRHSEPVGEVVEARVSDAGIWIRARFVKLAEPGELKSRLDDAWLAVRHRLVKGLSIGFAPIESSPIQGTWGTRFHKWAWRELSTVTLAANDACSIETVKASDTRTRAGLDQNHTRQLPPQREKNMAADSSVSVKGLSLRIRTPSHGEVVVDLSRASAQVIAAGLRAAAGASNKSDEHLAVFADLVVDVRERVAAPRRSKVVRLGR